MEYTYACQIINFAIQEKREEFIKTRWINGYQHISLDEFKNEIGVQDTIKKEEKGIDEIMLMLKNTFK